MHRQLALAVTTCILLGASLLLAACGTALAADGTELVFGVQGQAPSELQVARVTEVLTSRLQDRGYRGARVEIAAEAEGQVTLKVATRKDLESEQANELAGTLAAPGKLSFLPVARPGADPRRVVSLPQRGSDQRLDVLTPLPGEVTFSSADLGSVFAARDMLDYPALAFDMHEASAEAFGAFTAELTKRRLAIVLDGIVVTAPEVQSALYGPTLISGGVHGFTDDEVRDMLSLLNAGELELELELIEVRNGGTVLSD